MSAVVVALVAALLAAGVQHAMHAWALRIPARDIRWVHRYALAFVVKIFVSVILLIGYALLIREHMVVFMLSYGIAFLVVPAVEAWLMWKRQS